MPPLTDWAELVSVWNTNAETITSERRRRSRLIRNADRIPELERLFLGKLVRANTESREKVGIVERICKHGDYYPGLGSELILVMRDRFGGIKTAWVREDLDLIQIYEGE